MSKRVYLKIMSNSTEEKFLNYYKNLIKNNEARTVREIIDDLGVDKKTVYRFFEHVGISTDCIGFEYSAFAKQVLLHTKFTTKSQFYEERQRVIEEIKKKQRNREVINRLKEISELKKARANLVSVLDQTVKLKK